MRSDLPDPAVPVINIDSINEVETTSQCVCIFTFYCLLYHITQARISCADKTGEFYYKNQNDPDVWFLAVAAFGGKANHK